MAALPIRRRDAIEQGEVHYLTGKPCKRGHVAMRYATNGCCVACSAEDAERWQHENKDRYLELRRRWNQTTVSISGSIGKLVEMPRKLKFNGYNEIY